MTVGRAAGTARRWNWPIFGAVLVVAAVLTWYLYQRFAGPPKPHRRVVHISLLRPPNQPPPPLPREVPPPLEKVRPTVRLPAPDSPRSPQPQQPAPDRLALDAPASAGSDSFGLGSREGGRDILLGDGAGGEGGGDGSARFRELLGQYLAEQLQRDERLRRSGYRAELRLWFGQDGAIARAELGRGTGDPETDAALSAALIGLRAPPDLPLRGRAQPIVVRVMSRALAGPAR